KDSSGKTHNRKIESIVEVLFDDIPYSPEASEAQSRIETSLTEKYEKLCRDRSEGEATDTLLS
ncbi:MAG: hypothetical protein IJ555_05805, partial [Ruminococcus sp.]|nr:hypothetical protein [Ruminococcus sp.]